MKNTIIQKNPKTNTKITLKDISNEHQKRIQENIKKFEQAKTTHRIVQYETTPFIVDYDNTIRDGAQVA